jgi:hypothetical protein
MNNTEQEMNIKHVGHNSLSFYRKLVFGLSGFLLFLMITDIVSSTLLLAFSIIALFLGFTNFGRQCPLLLSFQYRINRMKSKTKESITKK